MSQSTYCSRHPNTETNLRCGKCEVPLCPQCMVHTPVGVRCQECARVRRLPTFEVTTPFLARAIGAGIGLGIVGGVAVRVFSLLHIFPLLNAIAIVAVGYLVGAGISAAVNHKRGRSLKLVAAGSMLVAYFVIFGGAGLSLFGLLAAAAGIYVAVNHF